VEDLLKLDVHLERIPKAVSYIGPSIAGSAPSWLCCDLPRRPSPALDASVVDLALPLDGNPFYKEMGKDLVKKLFDNTNLYSHSLLLGCSGKYFVLPCLTSVQHLNS
jgi:hypothetical protein